ncbi:DUF3500 domain-containing protein, partial [bacterium]
MKKQFVLPLCAAAGTLSLGLVVAKVSSAQQLTQTQAKAVTATTEAPTLLAAQNTDSVVDAANAFLAMLSAQQKTTTQIKLKANLAGRWSNFPVGFVPRNGVFFRDLNDAQVAAALKVARLALGEEGFKRFGEIRAADDELGKAGGGGPGGPRAPFEANAKGLTAQPGAPGPPP